MSILNPSLTPAALYGLPAGVLLLTAAPASGHELWKYRSYHLEHLPALNPCRQGLDLVRGPRVAVAAVHEPEKVDKTWLALEFGVHLADHRRTHAISPIPCLTTPTRPDPLPDRAVRIPHLAEAMDAAEQVTYCVVWELMAAHDAAAWLGRPLPDQTWFESYLPALLTVRRLLREGRLPSHPACAALMARLVGRYLSIRFAYQNPALIAEVIAVTEVEQVEPELAGVADDRR